MTTPNLLDAIARNDYDAVVLRGAQNGGFTLLLDRGGETLIHENPDGTVKEYPQVGHALSWLKRVTDVKEVVVDIEHWRDDARQK